MQKDTVRSLGHSLSASGAWAFALGTSVGWGSLVVTANTYLIKAGPWGSALGLLLGAVIMCVISRSYAYMMSAYPECGGAYAFTREVFGYDHAFLAAWFLALTYLAMLWANATALPLFARYFLGNAFHIGRLYTIFGYEVYLGEALLTIAALWITALLCTRNTRAIGVLMTGLVTLFTIGITICFVGAFLKRGVSFQPGFVPDSGALSQVIRIACISPWAFIGFESISHGSEEFSFRHTRIFRVLLISVITTTLLYVFVTLLSVTAWPEGYSSWLAYIQDLGNLEGIEALPAFFAARHYMGPFGVSVLMLSLLALIVTSLIGNTMALSRLLLALGRDGILPARFTKLNGHGAPSQGILLVAGVSTLIPFLGRTAIGWIVDVTTIGAVLIYSFVSASAMKLARSCGDKRIWYAGAIGLAVMIAFGAYLIVPNLFTTGTMAAESYFLFVVWAALGFICFRIVLKRDKTKRFGRSIIVWIGLLSLILFVSLVWMNQSILAATNAGFDHVQQHFVDAGYPADQSGFVAREMEAIRRTSARSIVVVVALFALSLGMLLNNYALMSRRALESEAALDQATRAANTDPLTGVKSKHAYVEKERELDGQMASGNAEPFAIVVCDVNGLKHVNDTLGHKAGDEYIRAASALICEIFSHSPVYRTGGDEFVVFLSGRDREKRAELMQELHDRSVENIAQGQVVVSGGMADHDRDKDGSVHAVFERADALMYREKQALKQLGARTRD